jgi:hypothetical protein
MDFVTIVSIWPVAERAQRPLHIPDANPYNGGGVFELPATPKGSVTLLRIGRFKTSDYAGNNRNVFLPCTPVEVANDLVRTWVDLKAWTGMPPDAQPGIWVEEDPQVTAESVLRSPVFQRYTDMQVRFARAAVAQARALYRIGKTRDINDFHFHMADYLGTTGEPWQTFSHAEQMRKCPLCQTSIPVDSIKCAHCREVVDAERYAAYLKAMDGFTLNAPAAAPAAVAKEADFGSAEIAALQGTPPPLPVGGKGRAGVAGAGAGS